MNEISVKTLYPDGSTSPYRALALPAFASLCLMAGALLVLFRTWDELVVPRWALVLAAAAGYVSASAAHRLSRRHGAFYLLGLVPWIPAALMRFASWKIGPRISEWTFCILPAHIIGFTEDSSL